MSDDVRTPERIATASIRGYYYQFLWTALRWIGLGEDESLVCEGAEDIDKHLGERVEQESLKHLAGNVTENSPEVKDALLNFLEEYVFQLRRGRNARFIFRTTANLGAATKHPLLGDWLAGGPADIVKMFVKADLLAREAKRKEALVALRYLRRFGLLKAFCAAIEWKWGELDYEDIRRELARRILEDPRFAGLSPDELADRLTAIIIHVSSSGRLEIKKRRLTRLRLDFVINDALLNKLVDDFRRRPDVNSPTLHVAHHACGSLTAIVVGRFGSAPRTEETFRAVRASLVARPAGAVDLDIFRWPLSDTVVEAISTTDADFYAAFCRTATIRRREVRLRWLLGRLIAVAKRRAAVSQIFVTQEWEQQSLMKRRSRGDATVELGQSDAAHMITRAVAEAIACRQQSDGTEWAQLTPWVYGKLRYIQNWDSGEIFTQENPLP